MSIEETIKSTVENILTSVLAEKLAVFNNDCSYPPIMTQSAAMKWLGIGNESLQYYISKGMPIVKNDSGSLRIPRDAVIEWFKTNWEVLA